MKKRIVIFLFCGSIILSACGKEGNQKQPVISQSESEIAQKTGDLQEEEKNLDTISDSKKEDYACHKYVSMSPEEITASLTLEQKASQMVQPAVYRVTEAQMRQDCYGSILSKYDSVDYVEWQNIVDGFQKAALESDAAIPYLYGQDDVHGVNYCLNSVIFPHNIGLGAANDVALMYEVGQITADEAKLCHMLWNFAPCVAQSVDPRWGRTYESYGADLDRITNLSTSYTKGMIDGGLIACPKHFLADGNVSYGTGEKSDVMRLIDRGDSVLTDAEIAELLSVYQAQIDAEVQTIMISHSSLNSVKMHENATYIQYLKNEMGFQGFIVSDWNSVQNTSASTYEEQIINAVNAGVDMLMEVDIYDVARENIIKAVKEGKITEERINDAVTRILRVKQNAGIFEDPYCEKLATKQTATGSAEYRHVAEKLVEESLVLLKNDNDLLPLKPGTTVFVTGPAAANPQAQCGGWTIDWNNSPTVEIDGVTTLIDGLKDVGSKYGITVITDEKEADKADVVLLAVGEQAYAEWNGDTMDLELCGSLGLSYNQRAIDRAKSLNKPIVTCIIAGRHVLLGETYDDWDSVVMCYLPGSEGQGIANVLCGKADFIGTLPSPWYSDLSQIGTEECWLPVGYGLTYHK